MNLTELQHRVPARKPKKRVGRGIGSGSGKTCGRGHKGQGSRAGSGVRLGFEGGQMPLFRRMPKKGFSNTRFGVTFTVLNVKTLARVFEAGATIELGGYREAGLVKHLGDGIKILGEGELGHALTVHAHRFSATARQKIEAAGGSCIVLPHRSATPEEREAKRERRIKKGRPKKRVKKRR